MTFASTLPATVLDAVTAGADHTSATIDMGKNMYMSIQLIWAALVGTPDATLALEVSLNGTDFDVKSDSNGDPVEITVSGTDGNEVLSLNGVVSEPYCRLVYTHNTVSAGTITALYHGKGSGR